MIDLVLFAGLIWGLLTDPCEVWAAYLRARAQRRRAREYRPTPPPYEPEPEPHNPQREALRAALESGDRSAVSREVHALGGEVLLGNGLALFRREEDPDWFFTLYTPKHPKRFSPPKNVESILDTVFGKQEVQP